MQRSDIIKLLNSGDKKEVAALYREADNIRRERCGDGILLRGLVEYSSFCGNACLYCGLNRSNKVLKRYRMNIEEVMDCVRRIASSGIRTIVLQSGEEKDSDPEWLAGIIKKIRENHDMAVTISSGEKSRETYRLWYESGADRYLLKIETADKALYESLHPGMDLENRKRCLVDLKELGYQNGSGLLIGLPGQTAESIAEDILYLKSMEFDMIGIGLFIPHGATSLAGMPHGDLELTIKTLAITRILMPDIHMPVSTSIGSVSPDYRILALNAGANVLMPNFTPERYKKLYEIYPSKTGLPESDRGYARDLSGYAAAIGRHIDYSKGDALRKNIRRH